MLLFDLFQGWISASRECFFTWMFLGSVMGQLSSHNKFRHKLVRDTTIMSLVTLVILVLAGLVGVAVVNLVNKSGYTYTVSSFGEYE